MNQPQCYCDPSIAVSGCNEKGCQAMSVIFLVFFTAPLVLCIYRLCTIKMKQDNLWSIISHSFIAITCCLRIARACAQLGKVTNPIGMAFLFLYPIGFLICSYFNTLYVWIKIIYHVNFSKVVERIFPFLGKTMIGSQIVLMLLLIIGSIVYWEFWVTNLILGFFLLIGAVGFAVFGKMIWKEYRDVSSKDCGVFSENTHNKIQKVTKLSMAAIIVTFLSLAVIVWSFLSKYPQEISNFLAFTFVSRIIEIVWIVAMLLVLSPSLQTWNQTNSQRISSADNHFDDLSDSSIDIENEKNDPTSDGVPPHPKQIEVQAKNNESTIGGSDV